MRTLGIDIETYSSVDLKKAGVYKYTSAPDFQVLLFAYAFDDEAVSIVDLATGEVLPEIVIDALFNDKIIKTAFNANFELTCLSTHLKEKLNANSWRCTAVQAAMLGLPLNLDGVAKVLNLDNQKMKEGKQLINYFSMPCKPTKMNEGRTRNLPYHAPDKWQLFKTYCKTDVDVERAIRRKLEKYPIPDSEQALWVLDQKINRHGIEIDTLLVDNAIFCDQQYKETMTEEVKMLTGIDNPNSVSQLKDWFQLNGLEIESLSKKAVTELAEETDGEVERLLKLRLEMAKTSIKKYEAINRALCPDQRVRGLLQFYGANRTGRWAGRLVQVHNLPQNKLPDLDLARQLVREGKYDLVELLFGSSSVVLSQLIRTAFIPSKNHRFIIVDFSAIEARVIAWLAGEKWRQEVFEGHGKIYEASASQMFKVRIEEITKTSLLRQKGKVAELALGYQGGANALISMGALDMGLKEEELPELVQAWRRANPNIVSFWHEIEQAAKIAVREKIPTMVKNIKFHVDQGILFITLPSGRKLAYIKPRLEKDQAFNRESLTYEGMDQTSKKWLRLNTYGGKLVENIVQAVARDCLAEAMLNVDQAGYHIVMHVHDEIVIEAPLGFGTLEKVCNIVGQPIPWAEGLLLTADGFESNFYRKE